MSGSAQLAKLTFILTYTLKQILTINRITTLPKRLYLAKGDKVGFLTSRFINGSQIEQQVFPEPFIQTEKSDKLQHYFKIQGGL